MVWFVVSDLYFGQPVGGRFTVSEWSTAFTQLPSIFNRSGFGSLTFTIASSCFFFINVSDDSRDGIGIPRI